MNGLKGNRLGILLTQSRAGGGHKIMLLKKNKMKVMALRLWPIKALRIGKIHNVPFSKLTAATIRIQKTNSGLGAEKKKNCRVHSISEE